MGAISKKTNKFLTSARPPMKLQKQKQRKASREVAEQQEKEETANLETIAEKKRASESEAKLVEQAYAFLKDNGYVDVNRRKGGCCSKGEYPIHTAVRQQNADMVRSLIYCKADVSKSSNGKTARALAEHMASNGT